MSHALDLMERFLTMIKKDYLPELGFQYSIDEKLRASDKNIRPDIQVIDKVGHVVCVVEIGYTRPEKLTLYHEIGIKDVRWYSKDGQIVNPHERIHEVLVRYYPEFPEEEVWREVDLNQDSGLICESCLEIYRSEEHLEKCQVPDKQLNEIEYNNKDEEVNHLAFERYLEEADIFGELWCNGARWFCIWLCDECGGVGFMTGDELKNNIFWDDFMDVEGCLSYDKFLEQHFEELNTPIETKGGIERMIRGPLYSELKKKASFEELREYISDMYDYKIEYTHIGKTPKPSNF